MFGGYKHYVSVSSVKKLLSEVLFENFMRLLLVYYIFCMVKTRSSNQSYSRCISSCRVINIITTLAIRNMLLT